MIKHTKPKTFYDTFERKGKGQTATHYCPGCGHGTAHNLTMEVIDEMGKFPNDITVDKPIPSHFSF